MFPPVKKRLSLTSESTHILVLICADLSDSEQTTFFKALLWIHILVKNILMMDLFQLFTSPDVNWWTGVVWIIVMLLSAVWTLILTAPIHCRASIGETVMQCYIYLMKKQTHLHLMIWGRVHFQHIFIFGWTIT